ncbi:hypothetical protein VP01_3980g1, partial [Puccinia sorghi]
VRRLNIIPWKVLKGGLQDHNIGGSNVHIIDQEASQGMGFFIHSMISQTTISLTCLSSITFCQLARNMKPRSLSQQQKKCLKNSSITLLKLYSSRKPTYLDVLNLMNLSKKFIFEAFQEEDNQFIVNYDYYIQCNEPTNPSRKTIQDGLFKKKKRKLTSLSEEINLYLDSECEDKSTKPIQFWKTNSSQYLTLAKMSRNFLAVPALSAPCELDQAQYCVH